MKKKEQNLPQVIELTSHDYSIENETMVQGRNIKLFGAYNSYFEGIEKAFEVSPTNACIINNISQEMYGKGLAATDIDEDDPNFQDFLDIIPPEELIKICFDFEKMGQVPIQVQWDSKHEKVIHAKHLPTETVGMGMKNNKGEIKHYYYCADWRRHNELKVVKIPAFGTSREKVEMIYVSRYSSGMHYFSKVEYQPAINYALSEGQMSSFIINKISRGFNPTLILSFNNGIPTPEKQQLFKNKVKQQMEGVDGDNFIIEFNNSADESANIKDVPQVDAFQQYQWVSTEATQKIIMSHRIVSPILVGIKDNTGFGNNAEELKSAYQLHNAKIIRPKQDRIIEALNLIQEANGTDYDLYFETIMPIMFTDTDDIDVVTEEVEKETGIDSNNATTPEGESTELSGVHGEEPEWFTLMDYLAEDAPEGYDFYKAEDVGDEAEDLNYEALINELELADVESAPIKKSREDTAIYKVRYRYKKVYHKSNQRDFCRKMHSLSGQNKFFRKEDIGFMSAKGVNRSFGHKGQNYSIWKYKGGVQCGDVWERVIFRKKLQKNGEPYKGNPLQNTYRSNEKSAGLDPLPGVVTTPPIDMPRNGHHPNY